MFQQDGLRSHITIIRPGEWALSSPDLNPLEYLIWFIVEQLVYREHITNVKDLNKRAVQAWKKLVKKQTMNASASLDLATENVSKTRKTLRAFTWP